MSKNPTPERSTDLVVDEIISTFKASRFAQVPGYKRFEFVKESRGAVTVLRENGNTADVRKAVLAKAVEAVREKQRIYTKGPSSLRDFGITHVTSPTWALLRLLPLNDLVR
jgi:hypothetical protein